MKTIIFTTKDAEGCYQTIKDNWFVGSYLLQVRTANVDIDANLQSVFNNVRIKESKDYRVCLPQSVNPQLPQDQKVAYVLSLVSEIAKTLKIEKDDLYIVFHSGDLFSIGDPRRKTSHVPISEIPCSSVVLNEFIKYVQEGHVYQFRHDYNSIANYLLDNDGDVSALGLNMINFIEK